MLYIPFRVIHTMTTKIDDNRRGVAIIALQGGLGNQLFQLCAGLQVATLTVKKVFYFEDFLFKNRKIAIDTLVTDNERSRLLTSIFYPLIILVRVFRWRSVINVDTDIDTSKLQRNYLVLNGWFQSYNSVHSVHSALIERLINSQLFSPLVLIQRANAIGVHLRYGDYDNSSRTRAFHGLTAPSYYDEAIESLLSQLNQVDQIIFVTDDVDRAKETIEKLKICKTSIPINVVSSTAIEDLGVLSSCSGIVLSNSSFSWWAGYLGSALRASKVVAPKPWLSVESDFDRALVVPSWIFLDREILQLSEED